MIAIDTNVLVYAHRGETEHHPVAARELIALAEGAAHWGLPIFCAVEFLRVVTHRRVFSPPSTLGQAVDFLDGVVASPSCRVVLPGAGFLGLLADTSRAADARGNLLFDAQIAALCREHGISAILTNDRDFERFRRLDVRYLDSLET